MNTINMIGNWTKDNELKYTANGNAVLQNTLAINEGYGDKKHTYFIPVVIWQKQAENVANYTGKGSKVAVNGKITQRSYEDKQGNKRSVIEVVANPYQGIEFLDNKKKAENQSTRTGQTGLGADPMDKYHEGVTSVDVGPEDLPF